MPPRFRLLDDRGEYLIQEPARPSSDESSIRLSCELRGSLVVAGGPETATEGLHSYQAQALVAQGHAGC